MHIVVHDTITDISSSAWNSLIDNGNPFLQYEFLSALETSHCTVSETGWTPKHMAAYSHSDGSLIGCLPCYLKTHSYGEYIFDWAWSNAFHQHGIEYYPKLSNAVPFTPATGSRILISKNANIDAQKIATRLIEHAKTLCSVSGYSSFHSLFHLDEETSAFTSQGLLKRDSSQFHWLNDNYSNFDDFLEKMSSKKRKNIRRERRRVKESSIDFKWHTADTLTSDVMVTMYRFYLSTTRYYGAQQYLNEAFFKELLENFSERTMVLLAYHGERPIAGGLYFRGDDTLFGRYWGASNSFHSLHFETCYYQPIEWCIVNGYQRFEAGAQGEHKLARGLEPVQTYSSHWIDHAEFRTAIGHYLRDESKHVSDYQQILSNRSPFKSVKN